METSAIVAHGSANFLVDRLVNASDGFEMYVCDDCGHVVTAQLKLKKFRCQHCDQDVRISKIKTTYAFKLLQQELMATGINITYETSKDDDPRSLKMLSSTTGQNYMLSPSATSE